MPVLQLDDQQFPLKAGTTRIGAGADADVVVPGYSSLSVEALIEGGLTPTIRRAEADAHIRVNGVLLGAEPTPLVHGDKLEIAGLELQFADDAKGGVTQFVSASEIEAITGGKRVGVARPTMASGGRLVSLVDGKEYSIPGSGIVFGREAACDVVVPQNEVSRRHAEIVPGEEGYVLRDLSANGVFVNGSRVQGSHRLARADVLRIGTEEFRFYADVAKGASPAKAAAQALSAPTVPAASSELPPHAAAGLGALDGPPEAPALGAPQRAAAPASTPPAPSAPTVTPPSSPATKDSRPLLAMLESMNEGPGKGTRYELRTPLGHVGRGAHNDVRLSDESVSETHAKIQKREDGWYVVDMDSTNGTYVGGSRVTGERRLDGSPDVRFGGMKFRFTSIGTGSAADVEAKGTRAIAARPQVPAAPTSAGRPQTPSAPSRSAPDSTEPDGRVSPWIWIAVLAAIAAVAFFVLKGRA